MSVALDRYILTVLKMPSQGIKTELVTRLNNLSGLSGTPMSPMLTKWIQQNFGLSSVAAIQNWSAGKFSPDMLYKWSSKFPSQFDGSMIRTELYDALTGGGVVPPVANFSGSPTTIYAGDTVAFTDLSTNTPTSWSWAFAGGTPATSTTQNPSVVYNTAGTYNVDLTATNAGGSDLESKPNYITVTNPYLLDNYSGATAAYSVRKLSSSYTGSAIRVRRSSDNTEQDIGFSGLGLNTTALSSFVGAGNGFITKWYDQSGNNRDAAQTTSNWQCKIVNAGTIITENGKPAIEFVTNTVTGAKLTITGLTTQLDSSFFVGAVVKASTQTNYKGIFTTTLSGSNGMMMLSRGGTNNWGTYGNGSYRQSNSNIQGGALTLISMQSSNGNSGNFYKNSSADGTYTDTEGQTYVGIGGQQTQEFNGKISEIIAYPTDQSANRVGIETDIKNYYGI